MIYFVMGCLSGVLGVAIWLYFRPRTIRTKVVGVSYNNPDGVSRQQIIKDYAARHLGVTLKPEPRNIHDSHAVSVWLVDQQIGFLNQHLAKRLRLTHEVNGKILAVTGVHKPLRGVNIEFKA